MYHGKRVYTIADACCNHPTVPLCTGAPRRPDLLRLLPGLLQAGECAIFSTHATSAYRQSSRNNYIVSTARYDPVLSSPRWLHSTFKSFPATFERLQTCLTPREALETTHNFESRQKCWICLSGGTVTCVTQYASVWALKTRSNSLVTKLSSSTQHGAQHTVVFVMRLFDLLLDLVCFSEALPVPS